jgi:hypothetical protein
MFSIAPNDRQYELSVDEHRFRWDPPDLGYISYSGDVDGESMALLAEKSRRFTVGQPCVFLVVDMAKAGKISAAARKLSAEVWKDLNLRGIAVIGASASMRIIAGLVSRAIGLLNKNTDNPTHFFETELEALNWIATRRAALLLQDPDRVIRI